MTGEEYGWSAFPPPGYVEPEEPDSTVEGDTIRFMWDYGVIVPLWVEGGAVPDDKEWLRRALGLRYPLVRDLRAVGRGDERVGRRPAAADRRGRTPSSTDRPGPWSSACRPRWGSASTVTYPAVVTETLRQDGPMAIQIAQDPAADKVLEESPFALLAGMMLDQQFPMERAFAGPAKVLERFGTLEPAAIAAADPEKFSELCRTPPAIHRYGGSMAGRLQELAKAVVEEYDGDASRIWTEAATGPELLKRIQALPGFGKQKAQIFTALVAKQLGAAAGAGSRRLETMPSMATARWRTSSTGG